MFCSKCGNTLPDDAKFCSKCGAPTRVRKVNLCRKCGAELEEGTRFCAKCGTPVGTAGEASVRSSFEYTDGQKPDLSDYVKFLTADNIEKIVGASGLAPALFTAVLIIYWLISGLLRRLLGNLIYYYSMSSFGSVARLLGTFSRLTAVLMIVLTFAVLGILCALYFTKRMPVSRMFIGTAVNAALLFVTAVIYLSSFFGMFPSIIVLLAEIYLGLCVAYVIFLKKEGLSGEIDFRIFDDMKYYFKKSEEAADPEKYTDPNIVAYEETEEIEALDSYFDGTGLQVFGYYLLLILISLLSCGLLAPWGLKNIYKWKNGHTVIEGKRLSFNGTAMGLFGMWVKNYILTAITCGIYSFFAYVDLKKWEVKHTTYQGMENQSETAYIDSYFDGNSFENMGYMIMLAVGSLLTCGILYPFLYSMYYKWHAKHTVYKGQRLFYDGSGGKFFLNFILIIILSVLTIGLYLPWGLVRINKYFIKHTHIDATYRGPEIIVKDVNSQTF